MSVILFFEKHTSNRVIGFFGHAYVQMSSTALLRSLGEVVGRREGIQVGFDAVTITRSFIHPAGRSLLSLAIRLLGYSSVRATVSFCRREEFTCVEEERERVRAVLSD